MPNERGQEEKVPVPMAERITHIPTIAQRNDPIAGVLWITLSMALFAGVAALSRAAMNRGLDPLVVMFFRNIMAVLLLLPLVGWRGAGMFKSNALPLYGVRVAVSYVSLATWFYAIKLIPLGELTAIGFLGPLFGTLAAILFLGEKVRWRRWAALVVGFTGAMIMLRPTASNFGLGQASALLSAATGGFAVVLVKQLTTRDDPDKIVFLTNLMLTPISLLPALFVWSWPTLDMLPIFLGIGVGAVVGHISLVRGFACVDASLAQTFDFSKLPFAVAVGYVAFGETIDVWTWVGAVVIASAAAYITHREARLKRQALARATVSPQPGSIAAPIP